MKTIAMIPARYAATRFPGKLMQKLGDKTIIVRTYENTMATRLFDEVMVVTDSEIIFNEITHIGGYVVMSKKQHESGSDRIAEAVVDLDVDIVLNVQGDEPFVKKEDLENLLAAFVDGTVHVASLMHKIEDSESILDVNNVKVVVDNKNNALLFSRSAIPFIRDTNAAAIYYRHIGIYAFKKTALLQFTSLPVSPLEAAEKIECLRYLENGIPIKMILTHSSTLSIDTPSDLELAKNLILS